MSQPIVPIKVNNFTFLIKLFFGIFVYVCLCKMVKDKEIDRLISEDCSLGCIIKKTGAGTECGSCVEYLKDRYNKSKNKEKESE